MPKEGLILNKIIKFFKLLKKRIDILNAEFSVIKENKNNNLNPRSHG